MEHDYVADYCLGKSYREDLKMANARVVIASLQHHLYHGIALRHVGKNTWDYSCNNLSRPAKSVIKLWLTLAVSDTFCAIQYKKLPCI